MYFARWQARSSPTERNSSDFVSGLHDVATRWVVTHDIARMA